MGAEPVLKLGTLRCGCLKWHHTCYAKLLPIFIVLKIEYEVYQISVTYVKKKIRLYVVSVSELNNVFFCYLSSVVNWVYVLIFIYQ